MSLESPRNEIFVTIAAADAVTGVPLVYEPPGTRCLGG